MAAVFVYTLCVYVSHTYYSAPQDLQNRPREPKQLKLNILKGMVNEESGGDVLVTLRGKIIFKKSENPETDKRVNIFFVQFS